MHVMRSNPPVETLFLLKAFRYWLLLQDGLGTVAEDYMFDNGEALVTALDRIREVKQLLKASKRGP